MTQIAFPVMGRLMSTYQHRIIKDAPRSLFFYVNQSRGGPIPNTPKARQWAVDKRGATHFDCFTFHRFNHDKTPGAYKVGDFYCIVSAKKYQHIHDDGDIIRFVISLLSSSLGLFNASACRLIYLGREVVGLTIPASVLDVDHGGEILPHLYREVLEILKTSAVQLHDGRFEIRFAERVDVENKRIGADSYAVPFRIGEIDSVPDDLLVDLARTPRASPDMAWDQTIDSDLSNKLHGNALHVWRQQSSGVKNRMSSTFPKLTLLSDPTTGASVCNSARAFSAMKCARTLVSWITKRNLLEFSRRDALRRMSGIECLDGKSGNGGGVADALDILIAQGHIQECQFPPVDYAYRHPSQWYVVNPELYAILRLHPDK